MLIGFRSANHPQQTAKRGPDQRVDDHGTTPEVFDPLNARFGFTVDVAASPHNAKCPRHYTEVEDGLAQSWFDEVVWCNPPYSDLAAWVGKAWAEWNSADPPRAIVMLAPANRTEQHWWQELIEPQRDRPGSPLTAEFLRGRLRFIRHNLGHTEVRPNERPPFGCCLLIWQEPA